MPVDKFLRGSGLAAIVAGALWITFFVFSMERLDWETTPVLVPALLFVALMLLFAFGLVGLQRHYPNRPFVQFSFLVAYVGILWLIAGGLTSLITESGWGMFISGFFVFASGLVLIGLASLMARSPSPWGILMVLIAIFLIGFIVTGDEPTPPIQVLLGTAYGLGWIALGFILWRSDAGATPDSTLPV